MKHEVVPITNAHKFSERILVQGNFPDWAPIDNVGLNINQTENYMDLAGISKLELRFVADEISRNYPAIVGIDSSGTALASYEKAEQKMQEFESTTLNENFLADLDFRNLVWQSVRVKLNLSDLQDTISTNNENIRHPAPWARYIDERLRKNLSISGVHHLLSNFSLEQKFWALVFNGQAATYVLGKFAFHMKNMDQFTYIELAYPILFAIISNRTRKPGGGYRFNLLPGLELDRAIVLKIKSLTTQLVTTLRS